MPIFTYLPTQRVLMLLDIVFPGWVPFPYLVSVVIMITRDS